MERDRERERERKTKSREVMVKERCDRDRFRYTTLELILKIIPNTSYELLADTNGSCKHE